MQDSMRLAKIATLGVYLMFFAYVSVVYFSNLESGLRDFSGGDMVGRDFINFWSGGRAAINGQTSELYQAAQYREMLGLRFGEPLNNYSFSYPPHSVLIFTPFGALPYVYGLILWTLGGLGLAYAASRTWFKRQDLSLWIVIGPAALIALFGGQTGLWLAGIWMLALSSLDKRPILAGVLIGILTVKPQMGVLLALFLLCGGYWKVIISASVTASVMILTSVLFYGIEPWTLFIHETLPYQSEIISRPFGIFDYMVHSPFKWMINLKASLAAAWMVQIPFMLFGAIALIWACRKPVDKRLLIALLSVLTFLFSPYMVIYDMTILIFAACLYWQYSCDTHQASLLRRVVVVLLIATPILGFVASQNDMPLSVILMSVLAGLILLDIAAPTKLEGSAATSAKG